MSGHTPWKEIKERIMRRREGNLDRLRALVLAYQQGIENDPFPDKETAEQGRYDIVNEAIRLVDEYDTRAFPHLIVKQDYERDVYITWAMSADGPGSVYTRAELEKGGASTAALRRADETGSSQIPTEYGQSGAWDDAGFVVSGRWWIKRADLEAYTRAYLAGGENEHAAAQYLHDCDDTEHSHGDEQAVTPEAVEHLMTLGDPDAGEQAWRDRKGRT